MGLLDTIKDKYSSMDDFQKQNMLLGLAEGFAGMTANPNAGQIIAGIQNQRQGIMDARKEGFANKQSQAKRNATIKYLRDNGFPKLAAGVETGALTGLQGISMAKLPEDKSSEMERSFVKAKEAGYTGSFMDFIEFFKGAGRSQTNNFFNDGTKLSPPEPGTQHIIKDGIVTQVPIAGGKVAVGIEKGITQAENAIKVIDKALSHPGLAKSVGPFDSRTPTVLPDATAFEALHNQIKGKAFLEAFESLKGGGQITEMEGLKAEQAQARLELAQDETDYIEALNELKNIIINAKQRNENIFSTIPTGSGEAINDPLNIRGK